MESIRLAERYEIVRPLGRGSFAQTLLARDLAHDRLVAIKVLHPRLAQDWKTFELFEREAAVLRELRHQGIPAVHESFRAPYDGSEATFLVMEYVEGASLAQIIAEQRHLDRADVLQLFLDLLAVLDYLHSRLPPILHRDIKPANVIVRPDGSPALVDFGAVRNVFRGAQEGGSTLVGTYGYMPYEQTMAQASPSSDLYALAATFLHLITGRAPPEFMGDDNRLVVPAELPCGEPLRSVLARLLEPAPAHRYQSARETRRALLQSAGPAVARIPAVVPASSTHVSLSPAPRPLDGEAAALLRAVAFTPGKILNSGEKGRGRWSVADVFLMGLFSVLTAGVLPAVVWSTYRSRKRRLKPFVQYGHPALARLLDMKEENIGFDIKLTRVRYEFEVNGKLYRDSDHVLPAIARRWDTGTELQILYLPDDGCDSVIISTS
jgi:serine/threonine protein kinase